jgi:hypothetical protein
MKTFPVTPNFLVVAGLLIYCAPTFTAQMDTGWEFAHGDENVIVYYRTLASGNVEFKGVTTVSASLNSLVALFADLDNMPNWVYQTTNMVRLEEVSENEGYLYSIHTMPFPFKQRDIVILSRLSQDSSTYAVTIHGSGKARYIPETKEYVRVQAVESYWQFYPLGDGKVRITFQGYGEPGGSIPSSVYRSPVFRWLVEMYLWRLPYTTLSNLRKEVRKEKYQLTHATKVKEAPK